MAITGTITSPNRASTTASTAAANTATATAATGVTEPHAPLPRRTPRAAFPGTVEVVVSARHADVSDQDDTRHDAGAVDAHGLGEASGSLAGVTRLWWNGRHRHDPDCAYLALGRLPDGRWFVQHTATRRWAALDDEADAAAVAQRLAGGWIEVPMRLDPADPLRAA